MKINEIVKPGEQLCYQGKKYIKRAVVTAP